MAKKPRKQKPPIAEPPPVKTERQIFIDCETTGGYAPRIIELAMVKRDVDEDGNIHWRDVWARRYNPEQPISYWAWRAHGITDEDLELESPIEDDLDTSAIR
jgi:DNA polymerase III epsilon subunit-like protein